MFFFWVGQFWGLSFLIKFGLPPPPTLQIPSDGSLDPEVIIEKGTSSWRAVAISVGVVASVLIPLLAYLAVRIRDMKHMVSRIVDEVRPRCCRPPPFFTHYDSVIGALYSLFICPRL
jgi:hypothetical protein